MSRLMTLLTAALLVLTVPLFGLVRQDLERLQRYQIQAEALPSPTGFAGMRVDGGRFALADMPDTARVGFFVLHRETLAREVAAWSSLQAALAPAGVVLVGTCEDAACVAQLGDGDAVPRFTVLASVPFVHARTLARLDAGKHWLLCDGAGRIKERYPIPRDAATASELARLVLRPAAGEPHAEARS